MDYIEADPLPAACRGCPELDCDECDHLGERWILSPEDQRRLERIAAEKAAARLRRILNPTADKDNPT